jgi:CheY-like chemotaxis protein
MGTQSRHPGTVLVVDDEPHVLQVVSVVLRSAGFHVIAAEDGAEALDLLLRHGADAVVTDLNMPLVDGLQLASRLYADERTRSLPVVILTAQPEGHAGGFWDAPSPNVRAIVSKPFSPRGLVDLLRTHLDRRTVPGAEAA